MRRAAAVSILIDAIGRLSDVFPSREAYGARGGRLSRVCRGAREEAPCRLPP